MRPHKPLKEEEEDKIRKRRERRRKKRKRKRRKRMRSRSLKELRESMTGIFKALVFLQLGPEKGRNKYPSSIYLYS